MNATKLWMAGLAAGAVALGSLGCRADGDGAGGGGTGSTTGGTTRGMRSR